MSRRRAIANAIARAFSTGWPDRAEMVTRASEALGRRWGFLDRLATETLEAFHVDARLPLLAQLTDFIAVEPTLGLTPASAPSLAKKGGYGRAEDRPLELEGFDAADLEALSRRVVPELVELFLVPRRMRPVRPWPVPSITTEADLIGHLRIDDPQLWHFTALGRRERKVAAGPLRNYLYSWRKKRRGGRRLVEAPKPRLRRVQSIIARTILAAVPPHEAAHGFRRGRSIVTHARPHASQHVVLSLDLAEFFPSISGARVAAIFQSMGYPEHVARTLALLTTNATPPAVLREHRDLDPWLRTLCQSRHLPQGAPSSPALANLAAYHLDRRLSALAAAFGATYTRYADDLVFSGDAVFERRLELFTRRATEIVRDEGFRVHPRKTRVARRGVRQTVTGLVVNARPNVPRVRYERLKAILHNAARSGPASQNREQRPDFRAHLQGELAFVRMVSPTRGERLQEIFDQIDWSR